MGNRHRDFVLDEHGQRMQVIRPKDPRKALDLARTSLANQDAVLFDRLPAIVEDAAGAYTFMGYLARRVSGQPCIVDASGKFVAECAPGDSFVTGWPEKPSTS
jgi:hypothetical protein